MTIRDRLIERRRDELVVPSPTRAVIHAESDDPAVTALRNALRNPRIPDEAKSLMRQSVAAMVAAWTLTTKEDTR